ncbi:MAG: hypothetical protein ACXWNC_06980 [Anaerolineales bacterium]
MKVGVLVAVRVTVAVSVGGGGEAVSVDTGAANAIPLQPLSKNAANKMMASRLIIIIPGRFKTRTAFYPNPLSCAVPSLDANG